MKVQAADFPDLFNSQGIAKRMSSVAFWPRGFFQMPTRYTCSHQHPEKAHEKKQEPNPKPQTLITIVRLPHSKPRGPKKRWSRPLSSHSLMESVVAVRVLCFASLETGSAVLFPVETAFQGQLKMIKGETPVRCFSEHAAVRFCGTGTGMHENRTQPQLHTG